MAGNGNGNKVLSIWSGIEMLMELVLLIANELRTKTSDRPEPDITLGDVLTTAVSVAETSELSAMVVYRPCRGCQRCRVGQTNPPA